MTRGTYQGHRPRNTDALEAWHSSVLAPPALEPDLAIVDCHHHLYGLADDIHRYPIESFVRDLRSGHRVIGTVYVEAYEFGWRPDGPDELRSVGEIEEVLRHTTNPVVTGHGPTSVAAGIVSHIDMMRGARSSEVIDQHLQAGQGRLRGVRHRAATDDGAIGRHMGVRPPKQLLRQPTVQHAARGLAERQLAFDVWVYCTQLDDVIAMADACPDTLLVLDHVGGLLGVAEHAERHEALRAHWRADLKDLAARDNVRVKIGGLGTVECGFQFEDSPGPSTAARLAKAWRPVVEFCVQTFGSHRCMFESNFPVDKQSCSYVELWNAFKLITVGWSDDERHDLFHRTACQTYRLKELEAAARKSDKVS
jgi:L-fuconolactonase